MSAPGDRPAGRHPRLQAHPDLGAAIQRDRTADEVFARLRAVLPGLGLSPFLLLAEPEGVRLDWGAFPADLDALGRAHLGAIEGYVGRWTPLARSTFDEGAVFSDDWPGEAAGFVPPALSEPIRQATSAAGLVRCIGVRLDERSGRSRCLGLAGDWLIPEDVPAMRLFGAQVAAALDACRTIAELSRNVADLAALNRIGALAGEVADLDSFFARVEEIAREATGCAGFSVHVVEEGERLVRVFGPAEPAPVPAGEARLCAVLRERTARVVTGAEAGGPVRSVVWVPLVARSRAVGVAAFAFAGPAEAVRGRLDLLTGIGAHLAGAVESRALVSDLRGRVAELTLLNDVAVASAQLDPVLLLDSALRRVCETFGADCGAAFLREGERLALVAGSGLGEASARRHAWLAVGEGLPGQAVQRLAPIRADEAAAADPWTAVLAREEGIGAAVAVPLLAKSQAPMGAILFGHRARRPLTDAELALLSAVGVQLGVAVENARLFADVRRRLSDLEAVQALATRTFRNAPGDVKGLLEDGCRETARALACRGSAVMLASGDGRVLRLAAAHGVPALVAAERIELPLDRDRLSAEAIARQAPVWSGDVSRDPRSALCDRPGVPPLSMLAVPLTSRTATRGVLFLADAAGRAFTDADLALASALASSLAVGLENAELYAEARGRVEELSLLNDVGRTVAGTLDVEQVLAAGVDAARRVLSASGGVVFLYDPVQDELRLGAHSEAPYHDDAAAVLRQGGIAWKAFRGRRVVAVEDAARDPDVNQEFLRRNRAKALVAAPILLRGEPLGVLLLLETAAVRRFSDAEIERVRAISNQLAVAIDNARLYSEARRRAEDLALLHEVGRSLVQTLDFGQVLDAGIRNLARTVDAQAAAIALLTEDGAHLEVRAVSGGRPDLVGVRLPLEPPEASVLALAFHRRAAIVIEDSQTDPRVWLDPARLDGRAHIGLPLMVRDRCIGSAVIVEVRGPRRFGPAEVERASAIANQLAVAAENARLYEDLRRSYAELARAQRQLIEQERLAALGELSAVVAHEVRNPLGVIFNSLGSLRRLLKPQGDARMLLDIVGEEADRLNRIVGDLLDFARPATPVLRPEPLDRVVDEAVAAALAQNAPGVEVRRDVARDLPPVPIDARMVRQAVLNVAVNAVQAMPRGGALTIRTRREGSRALLELEDTGAGIPEEVRGRIFEPFFTTKASGTGLGLAVVKRIVDGHGGEISVRSRPGAGTTFSLRFPLEVAEGERDREPVGTEADRG